MSTDLVASRRFFQYGYLYTVMITIYLGGGGELSILGGKLLPLKYSRYNPERHPYPKLFLKENWPVGKQAVD